MSDTKVRSRVRYPDPVTDRQFEIMKGIDDGQSFSDDALKGLRQRGLVNQTGKLTPIGAQLFDLKQEVASLTQRNAELQRVNRDVRTSPFGRS